MSIRHRFNLRKKRVLVALFGCAFAAIASAVVSVRYEMVFLVTLASVVAAFVIMYLAVTLGFRCPRCRGQWGFLAMYAGPVLSIRKDLRFCPYCGADLDGES
jgi:hypothetical protein